ncbi:MAG: hypothetical protein AABZ10_09505 [Nitrospirota bacterium]
MNAKIKDLTLRGAIMNLLLEEAGSRAAESTEKTNVPRYVLERKQGGVSNGQEAVNTKIKDLTLRSLRSGV